MDKGAGDMDDHTVDFASEILETPPSELRERIDRLSPEMRATVLAEVARRFQDLILENQALEKEVENLSYHAKRLEDLLLQARAEK